MNTIKEKILALPNDYEDSDLQLVFDETKEQCAEVAQQEVDALVAERDALLDALKPICAMQADKYGNATETHIQLSGLVITGRKAIQLCEAEK